MADLGNLYFDVLLRDMTDADIDKIKKKLEKVGVNIKADVDRKAFEANIKEVLKNKTFKVNIEANKNIKKAAVEANKTVLSKSITDFLRNETFKANVDIVVNKATVQQAIRQAFAQAGLRYSTTASDARQNLIDTRSAKADDYIEAQKALAELRRAQAASAQAANQQADAMERVNQAGERQKGVMATIREQVANAYALYRVGRFLEGVIRISGEFQQQHVALQTILGDAEKADVLFARIKNLAVESPFKFGDLTGYAKQLAAFSIPYEELFDTLKRFGDLSAGLGVDMGRIILAYGQVRSAEFLKGTELRQFTEAGIPLVTELAKRYSELEGTLVSVGDVYDRISKKQVAFSDVKAVLWDLTNEGGRFFEMQAELTDTLKGKLDKLIDSYEIFLADLGESNNEILGGTLDILTDILGHWKEVENAIMGIVLAYGSYKAAVLAVAAVQKVSLTLETIQGVVNLTRAMQGLTAATKAQAVAQKILNVVTSANPFVLAATVLGSIAGLFIAFREETESEADAMTRLHESMQKANEEAEKTKSKADDLISVMKNEKNSIDIRNKAYDDLLEIYGLLFPNMTREQVLLMDEVKLRERVARAAREERKEKAKSDLNSYEKQLLEAQKKRTELNFVPIRYRDSNWDKKVKSADDSIASLIRLRDEARKIYSDIDKDDKEFAKLTKQRWYTESKKIAEEAGLKHLIPTDKETDVWEYFDRIKQGIDDINKKKEMLNPKSENYSTMLGTLDDELKAYEKIYYDVLGGKNEEALKAAEKARKEREKQAADEIKRNKKLGEEAAKAYAEGVKAKMRRISSQWDLYKELFELTGDKVFASTAFSITPVWDEAAKKMREEFEKAVGHDIDLDISDADAKVVYGELYDSWKEIKDRIEKNGIDLKVNAANAIKDTMSIEDKIRAAESKKWTELEPLMEDSDEYKAVAAKHDKIIEDLKAEMFALTPAFKDLFVDTVGMASSEVQALYEKAKNLVQLIRSGVEIKNSDGVVTGYRFTDSNQKPQIISANNAEQAISQAEKLGEKVEETTNAYTRLWKVIRGEKGAKLGEGDKKGTLEGVASDLASIASGASDATQSLSAMFDALGDEKAAADLELAGNILGSVGNIGQGIANKDPFAVIGGVTGIITSIAQHHDKKLDRAIKKSQLEVKKLGNAYKNLEADIERQLGAATAGQAAKMVDSLKKQRMELMKQYEAEDDKKKTDHEKLEDYKQQIAELEDQIKYFYEDLAKEQYGADLKGWAEQMADALTDAFAKGEDAAAAFDKTVSDILSGLVKNMIAMEVIMPAMDKLRDYMFKDGSGIFTLGSEGGTNLTEKEAAGLAGQLGALSSTIGDAQKIWDAINKASDGALENVEGAASGLSGGIQSVTEDTADLLASYLNGMRGDLSVNRTLIEQLVNVSVPKMSVIAEAQLQQLQMVAANTKRNADAADRIYELVNRVVDKGSNKLKV